MKIGEAKGREGQVGEGQAEGGRKNLRSFFTFPLRSPSSFYLATAPRCCVAALSLSLSIAAISTFLSFFIADSSRVGFTSILRRHHAYIAGGDRIIVRRISVRFLRGANKTGLRACVPRELWALMRRATHTHTRIV